MPHPSRNVLIAASVLLLHVGMLWALQAGLLRRALELVVPVQVLDVSLVTPRVEQPAALPPPKPVAEQAPPPTVRRTPAAMPARQAPTVSDPAPAPAAAVTAAVEPQPTRPAPGVPAPAAPAAAPAVPAPAPAAKVELPISDADYLHNPPPKWPRVSERLGERGLVVLRVLIGADGRPRSAQVKESSGYPRLDEASVEAALSWRYVPGKRGGVPEEMWVNVPIRWGD